MNTEEDVKVINFAGFSEDGLLVPVEDIPFEIERIFYVSGVQSQNPRGKHAHYKTCQILFCLTGSILCICRDQQGYSQDFLLDDPTKGLYIPEMIWDEQNYLSKDTVLLVLSNLKYDPKDYIHDFQEFKKIKYKNE